MAKRTAVVTGLLFGGALFAAGCSSISSGTVTGKAYEPESTYYTSVCSLVGKSTVCIPTPQTDPECWRLDLARGEDTGSVCVSREDYEAFRSGDRYPR